MDFNKNISELMEKIGYIYVSTSSLKGLPNMAIKGVAKTDISTKSIYFLDLYNGKTAHNLKDNPKVSISIVDFKGFCGYQLIGTAEMIDSGEEFDSCSMNWELDKYNRYKERISNNLKYFIQEDVSELDLPKPEYLVKVTVDKVLSLSPKNRMC